MINCATAKVAIIFIVLKIKVHSVALRSVSKKEFDWWLKKMHILKKPTKQELIQYNYLVFPSSLKWYTLFVSKQMTHVVDLLNADVFSCSFAKSIFSVRKLFMMNIWKWNAMQNSRSKQWMLNSCSVSMSNAHKQHACWSDICGTRISSKHFL